MLSVHFWIDGVTYELDNELLQDLLVRRVLGELSPAEREQLDRALASNPALAAEAASLERTTEMLGRSVRCAPPASLRARVLESARREIGNPPQKVFASDLRPAPRRPAARVWNWPFASVAALASAAAIACAFVIVDDMRLRRDLELQRSAAAMLREPNIVLAFSLEGSGASAEAAGIVLLDLDARRASIAVNNLPALPPQQSYHLWAVLESKNVPCGQFLPGRDGRILTQFAIPVDSYTSPIEKLILTVQEQDAAAAPLGPVAMTST